MPSTPHAHLLVDSVVHALPDGTPLLSIPSLAIGDERIALVGANGSGKSTLLRLLAGDLAPQVGCIARPSRVGWVPQGRLPAGDAPAEGRARVAPGTASPNAAHAPSVADALGVGAALAALARVDRGDGTAEDLALIADRWDLRARSERALAALGLAHLPLERPLTDVSGGEATRLALAAPLVHEPDLLLLDEPTNDLDADGRARVRALVAEWPRGLVVASHDRALLAVVDRVIELEGGVLRNHGGGWAAYLAQRAAERDALERDHANARATLERAERQAQAVRERQSRRDAAGRRSRDDGSQPKLVLNARRERSQGTGARLAESSARTVADARERFDALRARLHARDALRMRLPGSGLAAGTVVASLSGVAAGPPGIPLLRGVDLDIVGPERVAIIGPNGAGKSTLLRLLAGLSPPLAGGVRRGVPTTRIAFLDQRATVLDAGTTILDAFTAHHPRAERNAVHAALARFRYRAEAAHQPVATLSGGERMRAALACVLGGPIVPQCLVLDEPTNHLDLEHLEAIEDALVDFDGALVVASHDATFLDAVGAFRREDVRRWRPASAPGA